MKLFDCSPNLGRKNKWSYCGKFAYGENAKMWYTYKGMLKNQGTMEKELSAELFVIK
jgi:hypothetical protein